MSIDHFKKDEIVTQQLRRLFCRRGFVQTQVNRFEEYQLYVENKNFLNADNMITFMDTGGKLMALKPDVTLSIVKNLPEGQLNHFEKLFYIEEVCRLSRDTQEYKMLSQVGVELIGPQDPFVNLEIVDLALESLAIVSDDYILDVSHLGFVAGFLDAMELTYPARNRLMEALHTKSPHYLRQVLAEAGVNEADQQRFAALSEVTGPILEALPRLKDLILCEAMENAWQELFRLGTMLKECGLDSRVQLDFSVVNDLDYYNGLVFLGYIKGIPDVVLTGGRYDNFMRKLGKQSDAIGFGLSLSDLNTYFKDERDHDFDVLLTYDGTGSYAELLAAARAFADKGLSVRLERTGHKHQYSCPERYIFDDKGLRKETATC